MPDFEQIFTESVMMKNWQKNLQLYPEKAIIIGESWEETIEINSPISTKLTREYILIEVKNDELVIEEYNEFTMPVIIDGVQFEDSTMKYIQEGSYILDLNTCKPTAVNFKLTMSGDITLNTGNKEIGTVLVPLSMKTIDVIELYFYLKKCC